MNINPYIESPTAVAAKDQNRAAFNEWRNSLTPDELAIHKATQRRRQRGGRVRPDGRLEFETSLYRDR